MQSRSTAVFELPDGSRFTLTSSGEWEFGPRVPAIIREVILTIPAWHYVDEVLRDWGPYIDAIADITDAKVIERLYPDPSPPDAIF